MNVMILDDDVALLRSMELLLSERGHRVTSFGDSVTASLYLENEPALDVLLIDYVMSGLNGEQVLQRMDRNLAAQCKIVMMTGHMEQIRSTKILDALGVRHLVCKPLDFEKICHLVES